MTYYCIIVAGGSGVRMGKDIPKQFLKIGDKPILMHTIRKFYQYDPVFKIIVGLPANQFNKWNKLCKTYNFNIDHIVIKGGSHRFHTVKNCLEQVKEDGIVAIHDGVRPFVSEQTIFNCVEMAKKKGSAIPVIKLHESIREIKNGSSISVNRNKYCIVHTPQVFSTSVILKAYDTLYRDDFTDDASVVEFAGYTINLVESNKSNIKITTPDDLLTAEQYIKKGF